MRDERAALCNAAARRVLRRLARSRCARAVRAAAARTAAWRAVLGIGGSGKAYDDGVGAGPPPPLGVRTTPPPPPPPPRAFRGGAGKRGGGGKRSGGAAEGAAEGAALVCAATACSGSGGGTDERREDLRFGSEDAKGAFFLVRLLEGTGGYDRYEGPRHFDAHAYRTEDWDGVWDFARGCIRTYKILAARAAAFDADPEVREILEAGQADPDGVSDLIGSFDVERCAMLEALDLDPDALAAVGKRYERLDQLAMEHLLGVRG